MGALGAEDMLQALLRGASSDVVAKALPSFKTHESAQAFTIQECKAAGLTFQQCMMMNGDADANGGDARRIFEDGSGQQIRTRDVFEAFGIFAPKHVRNIMSALHAKKIFEGVATHQVPGRLLQTGTCEAGSANGFPIKKGMELIAFPVDGQEVDYASLKIVSVVELRKDGVARAGQFLVDRETGLGVKVTPGDDDGHNNACWEKEVLNSLPEFLEGGRMNVFQFYAVEWTLGYTAPELLKFATRLFGIPAIMTRLSPVITTIFDEGLAKASEEGGDDGGDIRNPVFEVGQFSTSDGTCYDSRMLLLQRACAELGPADEFDMEEFLKINIQDEAKLADCRKKMEAIAALPEGMASFLAMARCLRTAMDKDWRKPCKFKLPPKHSKP